MKTVRIVLSVATILLLAGGYLASQYAAYTGQAPAYAVFIDQPAIRTLALVLFLAMIVFLFLPEKQEENNA